MFFLTHSLHKEALLLSLLLLFCFRLVASQGRLLSQSPDLLAYRCLRGEARFVLGVVLSCSQPVY